MTDSILRSGGMRSWSTAVVGPPPPVIPSDADVLLQGETDGYAINATDVSGLPFYTGAPYAGWVSVKSGGVLTTDNKPLDLANLANAGTSPKLVQWGTAPIARWAPHNLCLQSQAFNVSPWSPAGPSGVSVSANTDTGADGTVTADTLTFGNTGGGTPDRITANGIPLVNGLNYTVSVWVKAAAPTSVRFVMFDGSSLLVSSDVAVGTTLTRIQVTMTSTNTTASGSAGLGCNNAGTSGAIVCWGFQCNRGNAVTPYIPTTTAGVMGIPQGYDPDLFKYAIIIEPAATNLCLRSDNLTSASWTKTTMSTAFTAQGPDDATNSATTCTASGANATALQAITSASAQRVTSVWLKRRTGSGNIDITQDNGSTWTTMGVTSTWRRFALPAVTSTNPTVGLRIVTNGDAVDVWGFQHEVGAVPTTTIPTAAATATRAVDIVSFALSSVPTFGSAYTWYLDYKAQDVITNAYMVVANNTGSINEIADFELNAGDPIVATRAGGVLQAAIDPGAATPNAREQLSGRWKANDFAASEDGNPIVADTSGSLPGSMAIVEFGGRSTMTAGVIAAPLMIYRFVYTNRGVLDADLPTWRYNF